MRDEKAYLINGCTHPVLCWNFGPDAFQTHSHSAASIHPFHPIQSIPKHFRLWQGCQPSHPLHSLTHSPQHHHHVSDQRSPALSSADSRPPVRRFYSLPPDTLHLSAPGALVTRFDLGHFWLFPACLLITASSVRLATLKMLGSPTDQLHW